MNLRRTGRRTLGLLLMVCGSLLLTSTMVSGHHRHQWPYHYGNFPGTTISVYRCSPVSASAVQTVVASYNSNGGLGTVLNYSGDACSGVNGIIVKENTALGSGAGRFLAGTITPRPREIVKDSSQQGRVYFNTIAGQWKLINAFAETSNGSDKSIIAHEFGHGLGLHEHYVDVTGINSCTNPSVSTVMDCSGADQGPLSHDASDLVSRWSTSPWGTGAIWITSDSGPSDTSITLNWADINDNETSHSIYKNGSFLQYANQDAESATITVSGGECFYIIASNGIGTNTSSQICRSAPSAPSAPSGASASASPNNYTALLSWSTNASASAYTHEFVTVFDSGGIKRASYYVPHHGSGATSKSIPLGRFDEVPNTYSMEVSTCNAKYNAWSGFGCVYGTAANIYLSYP